MALEANGRAGIFRLKNLKRQRRGAAPGVKTHPADLADDRFLPFAEARPRVLDDGVETKWTFGNEGLCA
ncbi:protein of unknown function [Methylocella tundrae]|uniref:Uncharacterized protein n=1 Tax=Methylocella tundrae TaxID=227605 RepID=A0A4U8Z6B3_METTU|nr:protein of unknown function [Methylocella tundrae]